MKIAFAAMVLVPLVGLARAGELVFTPPSPLLSGGLPTAPAPGDVDSDGVIDLLWNGAIYLGDGQGGYSPHSAPFANSFLSETRLVDLTGDSHLDVVGYDSERLWFAKGFGDATFTPLTLVAQPCVPATLLLGHSLATGDLTGDGTSDVLLSSDSLFGAGCSRVFTSNGGEGLQFAGQIYMPGDNVCWSGVADFDEDGAQDVVQLLRGFGPGGGMAIRMWLGDDAPPFQDGGILAEIPDTAFADHAVIADFNQDLHRDVAFVAPGLGELRVFLGGGDGSLAPLVGVLDVAGRLAAGDFDRDGVVDLSLTTPLEARFLRGLGDGTFTPSVALSQEVPSQTPFLAAPPIDIDSDDRLDHVYVTGVQPASIYVASNKTYPVAGPIQDLGNALLGSAGWPIQWVTGSFLPGDPFQISLCNAASASPAFLVVGLSELNLPFGGGWLVPSPDLLVGPLFTDGSGTALLAGTMNGTHPAGLHIYWQYWQAHSAAPSGYLASTAVRLIVP